MIVFGGWVFWIIISMIVFVIIASLENEGEGILLWPSIVIVALIGLMWGYYGRTFTSLFTGVNIVSSIFYCIIYIVIGLVWSFFKWYKYVSRKVACQVKGGYAKITAPLAADNKEQLFSWILLFPFSMVRYAIGNLLSDFMSWLVEKFSGVYSQITNSIINKHNGAKEDMG